ncbi:MAG: hypothetical protein RSD47_10370 [Romboutsia sp.]
MKFIKDKRYRKLAILISIPILLVAQFYLFKFGIFRPMIKGAEVEIVDGDYIKDIDKFIVKLNDTLTLSSGDYIKVPSYGKQPHIWFNILDKSGVLKIEGNKLIAIKEGISSVAIMKNSRILKKADIKVVDPIISLDVNIDGNLKYVGDSAIITSVVESNYNRFKEKEKVTYESLNKDVIKITDNKIEAIGPGKASVLVKSKDDIKVFDYNIKVKVDKINIENIFEIELEETKKLKPKIITKPKNLQHSKIIYEFVESKLPVKRAIRLDDDGTVVGLRVGSEKVRIICGDKSREINIKVVDKSIKNNKIENLNSSYEIIDNKVIVYLEWDYLENVYDYDLLVKNNSLNENEFSIYKSIKINKDEIKNNRIKYTIEIELIDGKVPHLSIKVIGKSNMGSTKPSNTIEINVQEDDIKELVVENLVYEIDYENNIAKLRWDSINIENIYYNIYIRNNKNVEDGFTLLQNGIQKNEFTLNIEEDVNLEIYVRANQNDKYSQNSNTIIIKK